MKKEKRRKDLIFQLRIAQISVFHALYRECAPVASPGPCIACILHLACPPCLGSK